MKTVLSITFVFAAVAFVLVTSKPRPKIKTLSDNFVDRYRETDGIDINDQYPM
jgi:hypothetical protein